MTDGVGIETGQIRSLFAGLPGVSSIRIRLKLERVEGTVELSQRLRVVP